MTMEGGDFFVTKAKITFSNNETLIVKEGDIFVPINESVIDNEISSAMTKPFEIWSHNHDGLIPSLTEMLFNGRYFFKVDNQNVIYSTSAIVKIENL
jgi:hypothetical protein